jgi:hypothetical protein
VLEIKGGKYTTYRAMAEEAANLVCAKVAPDDNLANIYPTRTTPFAVSTKRPVTIDARVAWAKTEEGCPDLEAFMTCSTNWAWQKRWTLAELAPIAAAFGGGAEAFLEAHSLCE